MQEILPEEARIPRGGLTANRVNGPSSTVATKGEDAVASASSKSPWSEVAASKRRQITLRHSWAIQKMNEHSDNSASASQSRSRKDKVTQSRTTKAVRKPRGVVKMVKREGYTSKQKAVVRRASRKVKKWDSDEEALAHRIAMASLASGRSDTEDSLNEEVIDLVDEAQVSSGEDSVLGSSAPRPLLLDLRATPKSNGQYFNVSDSSVEEPDVGEVDLDVEALPVARLVCTPAEEIERSAEPFITVPMATPRRTRVGSEDSSSGVSGGEAIPVHREAHSDGWEPGRASRNGNTIADPESGIYVTATGSPDVAALFDSPIMSDRDPRYELNGAPSRLQVYVSSDAVILGASHLQSAIKSASSIGTYMPVAVGNHADIWLFDSGATLSQASPAAIERMLPFLTEVDAGEVDFISVESQSKVAIDASLVQQSHVAHTSRVSSKVSSRRNLDYREPYVEVIPAVAGSTDNERFGLIY